jgi:hypothetical protein
MARRNSDSIFSQDIGGINDPVAADGGKLIRAAHFDAQAKIIEGNRTANAISFLGTNAIEAFKGKLLADAEKSIKSDLSKLEGFGEEAVKAQKKLAYAHSNEFAANASIQMDMLAKQTGDMDDPVIGDFLKDIQRYKEAQSQNILSQQDVINRVAATVKRYTAMARGWGPEFRKTAADLTGFGAIDTVPAHQALTRQNQDDFYAKKKFESDMKLTQDIAEYYGLSSIDQVTPEMRSQYSVDMQANAFIKRLDADAKVAERTDKERGEIYAQRVGGMHLKAAGALWKTINDFHAQNQGVEFGSKEAFDKTSAQLTQQIGMLEESTIAEIRKLQQPGPNNPYPMTYAQAQQQIDDTRKTYDQYRKMMQDSASYNVFTSAIKNSQGDASKMWTDLQRTHPLAMFAEKTGVMPDMFKLYATSQGDVNRMAVVVGEPMAQALSRIMGDVGRMEGLAANYELKLKSAILTKAKLFLLTFRKT